MDRFVADADEVDEMRESWERDAASAAVNL